MGIFRKAGRAFGKANLAVTNATTPSWRKQKPKPQTTEPDYTGRDNVVNLRVKKGRESYDLLVDDSDIHVAYQSKEGKTKWRKTMSVGGEFTAIDPGSPPSSKKLNRHWGTSFKSSQGTYSGLDAQVKYLNDLGYDVQALDKRPVKAWRSGNKQDSDRFVQEVMSTGTLSGDAEYSGPYVDPRKAHNTADREFRNKFFRNYKPRSEEEKRGEVFDGTQWRKPPDNPNPPGTPGPSPTPPPASPPGAGPQTKPEYSSDAQFILDIIAKRQKNPFQATNPKPPEQKPGDTPGPQPSQNQQKPPSRQAIHIPGASGPLKYTGQNRPEKQPETPRKPLALYGKDELKQLTQDVLTRDWKFADESQKRSGPRSAWKPENPQKQLVFAPKPDDPASLERDPEALKFWEIFYRKKNEQSKIVEDVNAQRGRGKAGPLADTINVSRAQKVVIPGFWALDDLSPKQQAETSEKIKARAFGEANTSRAAAGMEIPGEITNDITKYTGKKAKGEATSEGQDRIYGGTQIAAGLQNELENVTDPELRQKMQSEIDRIIVQTEGLVEQKKLREQGKHYAANQKANELIDKLDPTGIIDAGRSVDPATGKSMPQIFATDAPTGVTDDIVQSANEAFGQFNKNLSNVSASGLRVMQVPSLWQKPGSTLEERMKQVPLAGETRAYPDDMMAPGEITDEKAIDRLMANPKVIAEHASDEAAVPKGTGDPALDEYVDAIGNSMGSIRKYMESSHMLGGNFDPAKRVLQSAQEYEGGDGLSRTAAKGNYYTDKSANVRLFQAEEAATRSANDARAYWRQQALANPNPALAEIDRTLPPEEQQRQVRELAAQDIESILAKHADNYKNPEAEVLDHPNIFQSVLAGDKDALGLTAEDETPDVGPLADSILERLRQGRLDEVQKIGDEGDIYIASVIDMFDRQGLQRDAAFYANLLEEQPTNPVAQNVASTTYNDMLNQGMTWPSNVRPDEKYVDPLLQQSQPVVETPMGPLPTYEELADILPENVNIAPDAAVAPPPSRSGLRRRSIAQEQPAPIVQPPVEPVQPPAQPGLQSEEILPGIAVATMEPATETATELDSGQSPEPSNDSLANYVSKYANELPAGPENSINKQVLQIELDNLRKAKRFKVNEVEELKLLVFPKTGARWRRNSYKTSAKKSDIKRYEEAARDLQEIENQIYVRERPIDQYANDQAHIDTIKYAQNPKNPEIGRVDALISLLEKKLTQPGITLSDEDVSSLDKLVYRRNILAGDLLRQNYPDASYDDVKQLAGLISGDIRHGITRPPGDPGWTPQGIWSQELRQKLDAIQPLHGISDVSEEMQSIYTAYNPRPYQKQPVLPSSRAEIDQIAQRYQSAKDTYINQKKIDAEEKARKEAESNLKAEQYYAENPDIESKFAQEVYSPQSNKQEMFGAFKKLIGGDFTDKAARKIFDPVIKKAIENRVFTKRVSKTGQLSVYNPIPTGEYASGIGKFKPSVTKPVNDPVKALEEATEESLRYAMAGVLLDGTNGVAVATDGKFLVQTPYSGNENRVVDVRKKTQGQTVEGRFPRYEDVFPQEKPGSSDPVYDLSDFLVAAETGEKANNAGPGAIIDVVLPVTHGTGQGEEFAFFGSEYMARAIRSLIKAGAKKVRYVAPSPRKAAAFYDVDEPKRVAVVMPVVSDRSEPLDLNNKPYIRMIPESRY